MPAKYEIIPSSIDGCFEIQLPYFEDRRGTFVKTYHQDEFAALGLRTDFKEEYLSVSSKGVIRGLHFQLPPATHVKLVQCLEGEVMDVVVDLRKNSPTFLKHHVFHLSSFPPKIVYIPEGLAHGFLSKSARSVLFYRLTSMHAPSLDAGILWNSLDIPWDIQDPILSDRDKLFPRAHEFQSPFQYES